jgi:AcrR family transcriptional regulator
MSAPKPERNLSARGGARITRAERKRQLLVRAKHLFVTLGYQSTTTEMVAAAASVSEAVLYKHFDSKKALFQEVLEEIRNATVARWETLLDEIHDSVAKLHAIIENYLVSTRDHPVEFRILHRTLIECEDAEIVEQLRSFYLDCEIFLARVIQGGQQSGVFRRSLDPRVGAWELIRSALGYTLTLPLGVPVYGEADYLVQATECLLHSLLKTDV